MKGETIRGVFKLLSDHIGLVTVMVTLGIYILGIAYNTAIYSHFNFDYYYHYELQDFFKILVVSMPFGLKVIGIIALLIIFMICALLTLQSLENKGVTIAISKFVGLILFCLLTFTCSGYLLKQVSSNIYSKVTHGVSGLYAIEYGDNKELHCVPIIDITSNYFLVWLKESDTITSLSKNKVVEFRLVVEKMPERHSVFFDIGFHRKSELTTIQKSYNARLLDWLEKSQAICGNNIDDSYVKSHQYQAIRI